MRKLLYLLPLLSALCWGHGFGGKAGMGGNAGFGGGASVAPSNTRVQAVPSRSNGAGFTGVATLTPTTGNLLTVFGDATGGGGLTMTISDTAGNSWSKGCANGNVVCIGNASADSNGCIHDISGGGIGWVCMWYAVANASSSDTITITQGSGTSTINLWVVETTGAHTLDVAAVSNGNSSFNASCTSGAAAAVAGAGELMIGQGADSNNLTYTPSGSFTTNDAASKNAFQQVMYNLSGSTGAPTFSATLSGSANWVCMGMAFK